VRCFVLWTKLKLELVAAYAFVDAKGCDRPGAALKTAE